MATVFEQQFTRQSVVVLGVLAVVGVAVVVLILRRRPK